MPLGNQPISIHATGYLHQIRLPSGLEQPAGSTRRVGSQMLHGCGERSAPGGRTSFAGVRLAGRTVAECRRTASRSRTAGPPQKTSVTKALNTKPAPYAQQMAGKVYRMTCRVA